LLSEMTGISQAYVTMKFNELFGSRGGLALNAGAFSNRYGLAGPRQQSSGYYNTQLFGRTKVVGEALTADIDLTQHLELLIEEGFGAKLEVIPWVQASISAAPYLPDQGPTPQGSNFLHQFHLALLRDDWLRIATHNMMSWSPNDLSGSVGGIAGDTPTSHLYVNGAELHLDSPRFGSFYAGYSHIDAKGALSLSDALQVIHASNGYGLVHNYLNPDYRYVPGAATFPAPVPGKVGDNGQIDTVMFQFMVRLVPLLDRPVTGRDLTL